MRPFRLWVVLVLALPACRDAAPPSDAPADAGETIDAEGGVFAAGLSEIVTDVTPFTLDPAACLAPDTIDDIGAGVADAELPTDPQELIDHVLELEAQLAAADAVDVPRLRLALGRAKTAVRINRGSPLESFATARPDEFGYNEIGAEWLYRGKDFRDVITEHPGSDLVDDAAYALTLLPMGGECEGWIDCYASRAWAPLADFLRAYPDSPLAAQAVARGLTAVDQIEADVDLRVEREFYNPSRFEQLALSLDSVGRVLPAPHKTRVLERAAQLWWQLAEYEPARAALQSAAPDTGAEVRACLEARIETIPSDWLALDPAHIVHPGRVDLTWQPVSGEIAGLLVYRSTAVSELGVETGRLASDTGAWTDLSTEPGTMYWYRVIAVGADGVVQSNPSRADTPLFDMRLRGIAVSTTDEYLHVFGVLSNDFPQVLRISPDGSDMERRDGVVLGLEERSNPFEHLIDEVWLTKNAGLGVLSFEGPEGVMPPELLAAVREGREFLAEYPRSERATRLLVSVDESEGVAWIDRGDSDSRARSIDCVAELAICWLGQNGRASLRDESGEILATFTVPGDAPAAYADAVYADPVDASVWLVFRGRLFHVDRTGAVLADVSLTAPTSAYSLSTTADLRRDRRLWLTRRAADAQYELARIDVDAAATTVEVVTRGVAARPTLAPDLNGGVWLVTFREVSRIGADGGTLLQMTPFGSE